jgi:hypothetical protein
MPKFARILVIYGCKTYTVKEISCQQSEINVINSFTVVIYNLGYGNKYCFDATTLGKTTLGKTTLDKMTLGKMTLCKMTLSKMTLGKTTLSKMTQQNNTQHNNK